MPFVGHTLNSKALATPPAMLHDRVRNQLYRSAPAYCPEQLGNIDPSMLRMVVEHVWRPDLLLSDGARQTCCCLVPGECPGGCQGRCWTPITPRTQERTFGCSSVHARQVRHRHLEICFASRQQQMGRPEAHLALNSWPQRLFATQTHRASRSLCTQQALLPGCCLRFPAPPPAQGPPA